MLQRKKSRLWQRNQNGLRGAMVAVPAPVSAQQPSIVNPTADAVKEQQLLQQLNMIQGRGTIPDVKSYVLEHPAGREWRQFHNVTLKWIGGIAIVGMLVILVLFYLWRGPMRVKSGYSGIAVLRFDMVFQSSNDYFKRSKHRSNSKGVIASCADCHIPTTNWFIETYTHASSGMRDVFMELTHNFKDQKNWEAHRAKLTPEVQAKLRRQDSVTCRSCHVQGRAEL